MRALVSVHDKTGLVDFARGLVDLGWELVASGGTAEALSKESIAHTTVEAVTGAKEMLGGRVKTLHPNIHGGILANLDEKSHIEDLQRSGIIPFKLVVCNLYPFADSPSIEMIDVGGPTMVRAAAKNHAFVGVVVDPNDYPTILGELHDGKNTLSNLTRKKLALKAFRHTFAYDKAISEWLQENVEASEDGKEGDDRSPAFQKVEKVNLDDRILLDLRKTNDELRYGENPHQKGARYVISGKRGWFDGATQHSGKTMSYLNFFDGEAAWRLAHEMASLSANTPVAVSIIKHANACGAAIGTDINSVYLKAMESDPVSAFGGVVAIVGEVDERITATILENPQADVLIASKFTPGAIKMFKSKRKVLRLIEASAPGPRSMEIRTFDGGFLIQEPDIVDSPIGGSWTVVTEVSPDDKGWSDASLAWLVCARTTSNAIVLAKDYQVVGVGAGQQSRVLAAEIASQKAGQRAIGGAAASDAFFPFKDGLEAVANAGVKVVVQPGGSVRDAEVIERANELGLSMIFTGQRHFRH